MWRGLILRVMNVQKSHDGVWIGNMNIFHYHFIKAGILYKFPAFYTIGQKFDRHMTRAINFYISLIK